MPQNTHADKRHIVLAAVLRSAQIFTIPSAIVLTLSGAGALVSQTFPAILFLTSLLSASYVLWLCWRLHFDSLLFDAITQKVLTEAQLDDGLAWFTGRPLLHKNMEQRLTGTRKLYWRMVLSLVGSISCFCVGVLSAQ